MIFWMDMGVAGAGWATIISQFISFCLLLRACAKSGNIPIHFRKFRFRFEYYRQIVRGGLPSLARQILASLATISLNHAAQPYGDAAIAAMGVVQRVMMFGASAMLGFGQGFQPVCGFNYGAGLYKRVKEGFWFCVKSSAFALVAIAALGYSFAPQLIALFQNDPEVVSFGIAALRFQCITFPLQSWIIMSNMMQQSMGRTAPATFLSVSRQGLFFIPMVLLLPPMIGVIGLQMAQSAADFLTFLCAVPIQISILKSLPEHP